MPSPQYLRKSTRPSRQKGGDFLRAKNTTRLDGLAFLKKTIGYGVVSAHFAGTTPWVKK